MAVIKSERALFTKLFLMIENEKDMEKLLGEIFSPVEIDRAVQRLSTTKALLNGESYRMIEKRLGTSTYVIHRVKRSIVGSKSGIIRKLLISLGKLNH